MVKFCKISIILMITVLLTGCGIFQLSGWVLPDDNEYIACIETLDTPRKISAYMITNFTYEAHALWTPNPYTLWQTELGDCNDFATFGVFAYHWNGGEVYYIVISYIDDPVGHMIAVYVEDDGMSFSDNQFNSFYLRKTYFNSFDEIVEFDSTYYPNKVLRSYIVYDYWDNMVEVGYR